MGLKPEELKERSLLTRDIPTFGPRVAGDSEPKPYVFISYASKDWKLVLNEMVRGLVTHYGLRVYYDKNFADDNLSWVENMKNAMSSRLCRAVICCISENYLNSYACAMELMQTKSSEALVKHNGNSLNIIPVIIDKSESIEKALDRVNNDPVQMLEWESYAEIVQSAIETVSNETSQQNDLLLRALENLKRKGEKVRQDDLATVVKCLSSSYERRYDDAAFEQHLYTTLKNANASDTFDETLKNSCPKPAESSSDASSFHAPVRSGTSLSGLDVPAPTEIGQISSPSGTTKVVSPVPPADPAQPTESPAAGKKSFSVSGNITYTLYGNTYTDNQSDMMLRFFAQVLKRHPECVQNLPEQKGMNCVSSIDYSLSANRDSQMPSYFRICQHFDFGEAGGICVGTAYALADKLRKMSLLLALCGEESAVFHSDQVSLPEVSGSGNRGNSIQVHYSVYDEAFTSNQADMMGNVFRRVLERHPDQLDNVLNQINIIVPEDYSALPRSERSAYFAVLSTFTLGEQVYSVGAALKMEEKLRQLSRLLTICGESIDSVSIDGYELTGTQASGRTRKRQSAASFLT